MNRNLFLEKHRPQTLDAIVGNWPAKRIITNMLARDGIPNAILFYGRTGCGKSTTARILARTLVCKSRAPGSVVFCGACDGCASYRMRSIIFCGQGIETDNSTTLTLDMVKSNHIDGYYAGEIPAVFLYEEFHRARERIQDYIVTWLEDEVPNFVLIICTLKPEEIEEALLHRLVPIELAPPRAEEMIAHMGNVCQLEEWEYDESVLAEIAEANGNEPRACMIALFTKRLMDGLTRRK